MKLIQHGGGILRPENEAINRIGIQQDFAYLLEIKRIHNIHKSAIYFIEKPVAVKSRYVCSSACAYNHMPPPFLYFSYMAVSLILILL
jgi:hypothetical protein